MLWIKLKLKRNISLQILNIICQSEWRIKYLINLTTLSIAKFSLYVYALSFSFSCISWLSNCAESEKNIAAPNISTPKALKAVIHRKRSFRTESLALSLSLSLSHRRFADTAHIYMNTRRHNELLSHREQKQKRSLLKKNGDDNDDDEELTHIYINIPILYSERTATSKELHK